MTAYTIRIFDEGGIERTIAFDAAGDDAAIDASTGVVAEWVRGGKWGRPGEAAQVYYRMEDADGYDIFDGYCVETIEI